MVKQVRAEVQSEPNLQRAVEKVREQVVSNPKMDREVAQKVEQALKETTQLQKIGQESAGRDRFTTSSSKSRSRAKTNRNSSIRSTYSATSATDPRFPIKRINQTSTRTNTNRT